MTDIQRAIKLLSSSIEADRRKAIKLLAEIGTDEAYEQIGYAYKEEKDPAIRALMVKAGKYIKAQQAQAVRPVTPKSSSYTPARVETHNEQHAFPEQMARPVELDLHQDGAYNNGFTVEKKKNSSSVRRGFLINVAIVVLSLVGGALMLLNTSSPWVNFASLRTEEGNYFGDSMIYVKYALRSAPTLQCSCVEGIDAAFSLSNVMNILAGSESPWRALLLSADLHQKTQQYVDSRCCGEVYNGSKSLPTDEPIMPMVQILSFVWLFLGLNALVRMIPNGEMLIGIVGGLLGGLLSQMSIKVNWFLMALTGAISLAISGYFYFSVMPRFVSVGIHGLGLPIQPYHQLSLLGSGFLLSTGLALVILIVCGFAVLEIKTD